MNTYTNLIESFDRMIVHFQSQTMEKFNLYSKGETCALHFLLERGEYAIPGEISSAMHCSAARITQLLTQLEQKGQIERKVDASDRRKVLVKLTKTGKERALREKEEMYSMLETIFDKMGENDTRELMRTLKMFFEIANSTGFIETFGVSGSQEDSACKEVNDNR